MVIYLDTSTLRRHSKEIEAMTEMTADTAITSITSRAANAVSMRTSSLAVFELMSGATDKDYSPRKVAVERLLECEAKGIVHIDWDSYKAKMWHAFRLNYYDEEGEVIRELAEKMVNCETFEEFQQIRVCETISPVDGGTDFFDFESLKGLDDDIVEIGRVASQAAQTEEWKKIAKQEQQESKEKILEFFPSYTNTLAELSVIPIAEDFANSPRPSEKYLEIIERYDRSLQLCFQYLNAVFLLAEMEGGITQKNDIFDILHLLYLKDGDTLIAEDKVFKRVNECLGRIKVMTWEEATKS